MLTCGQQIAVDLADRKWVELELKVGKMLLHHMNIVHGSDPNNSDWRRIDFAIRDIAPRVKQMISATDGAGLVLEIDHLNNFEHEPSPEADMALEGLSRLSSASIDLMLVKSTNVKIMRSM